MLSVDEALEKVLNSVTCLPSQILALRDSSSYFLAEDILADRPIPPFNRVTMDGYAVKAKDFVDSQARLKVVGIIAAGDSPDIIMNSGEAIQIMTGASLPESADAVVMVENSSLEGEWVHLTEPNICEGYNIAKKGEDAEEGKILLKKHTQLTPAAMAVCSSVGNSQLNVFRKPIIRVLSTGNEIISPEEKPKPHQIRDCNSFSVHGLTNLLGMDTDFLGIASDLEDELLENMKKGLEADVFLLSGGVSMGEFDLVPKLLNQLGVEQVFHKVNLKPGKPVWFGMSKNGTYVFGLPGNPVSVQVNYKLFVEPLIQKLSGSLSPEPKFLRIPVSETLKKKRNREFYLSSILEVQEGQTVASTIQIRGSGDFSNLAYSTGLIRFPADDLEIEKGSMVDFLSWM
jgi:molybdopterin molybdotransferase